MGAAFRSVRNHGHQLLVCCRNWVGQPMSWFTEQRIAWIRESVEIFGSVRREHIMKKFDISVAQASLDLREVRKRFPGLMTYDLSEKVYKTAQASNE